MHLVVAMTEAIDVELLPHQYDLVIDETSDVIALEGGLGSGKTFCGVIKMLRLISVSPGVPGLWIEPTYDLIGSIFLATVDEVLPALGIAYEYRSTWRGRRDVLLVHVGTSRETPVYCRSGEKPKRIVGFKIGWFIVDEADQVEREVWKRASGRLRDRRAKVRQQIAVFTPEEGFNWTWDVFHSTSSSSTMRMRLIEGVTTMSNTFNPAEYVDRLKAGHDDEDLQRILTGKRTQRSGLVYKRFDPARHIRECANPFAGEWFIGADFNVAKMVWVFGRRLGNELHFWGELIGEYVDTIEMAQRALDVLQEAARRHHVPMSRAQLARSTRFIPDASAGQRRTSSRGMASDLDHVQEAGFDVVYKSTNPPVKDRVFAFNLGLHENRIFVDGERCPFLVKCLSQQGWSESGEPDKSSGLDHATDAAGYPVHYLEPAEAPRGNRRAQGDDDIRIRRIG